MHWATSSNAPDADLESRRFRVIHPFHPLFGREYDLIEYRSCWAEDRVFYSDEDGSFRSLPASWTNLGGDDPFVAVSAGRAHFRLADLLELVEVVQAVRKRRGYEE
jgi:hypothetical protein